MLRTALALLVLGAAAEPSITTARGSIAWPHRAIITGLHGRPAAFEAFTLGGELIVQVRSESTTGRPSANASISSVVRPLGSTERLRAAAPADHPLNLANGAVVFVATGPDNLRLVVGRNPWGRIAQVAAEGRHFTVRLVADSVVIEVR